MNAMLLNCLKSYELADPLAENDAAQLASTLSDSSGLQVYPRSIACARNAVFFLGRRGSNKLLGVIHSDSPHFQGSSQKLNVDGHSLTLTLCETTPANAAALRAAFSFLVPQTLGLKKSAGCGDRLGLATPGHIRAIRNSTMA